MCKHLINKVFCHRLRNLRLDPTYTKKQTHWCFELVKSKHHGVRYTCVSESPI